MNYIEILLDFSIFLGFLPNAEPICLAGGSGTCTDHVKHEFSQILILCAGTKAVVLEVVNESGSIFAYITKVHSLPTFTQKQKPIEDLE